MRWVRSRREIEPAPDWRTAVSARLVVRDRVVWKAAVQRKNNGLVGHGYSGLTSNALNVPEAARSRDIATGFAEHATAATSRKGTAEHVDSPLPPMRLNYSLEISAGFPRHSGDRAFSVPFCPVEPVERSCARVGGARRCGIFPGVTWLSRGRLYFAGGCGRWRCGFSGSTRLSAKAWPTRPTKCSRLGDWPVFSMSSLRMISRDSVKLLPLTS
jgi:hypothetical protein